MQVPPVAGLRNVVENAWHEIALTVGSAEAEDAGARLIEAGFAGLEERPGPGRDQTTLVVFAEVDDAEALAAAVARALAATSGAAATTAALDERVWTENWRRHFRPLRIGTRLEVLPPWETPDPARATVVINPGLAFGTGQHATTAGCLALLDESVGPHSRVCDVGCGSGILSIAAARLGAAFCYATDNDPEALAAARENVAANEVGAVVHVAERPCAGSDPDLGDGLYDVVVANILAETLVELRPALAGAVAPGGTLILSGIESGRRGLVEEAFVRSPWRRGRAVADAEWVSLALHRPRDS